LSEFNLKDIVSIEEVTTKEYNINVINSIAGRYGALRQKSKAPT